MAAPSTPTPEPLSPDIAGRLADFAKACKAATRVVSMYPPSHPTIQSALSRITEAGRNAVHNGPLPITVLPDGLLVGGRGFAKPDPAASELASLLHLQLIGELTLLNTLSPDEWHGFLMLLAKSPEDARAVGGVAKAWAESGNKAIALKEIDYAEVLRERAGGDTANWDRIISLCLQGDMLAFDERALAALVEAVSDPVRFGALLDHFQQSPAVTGATIGARAAALVQLLRTAVDAAAARGPEAADLVLQTIADSSARLTPEMMLAVLAQRQSDHAERAALATAVVDRMSDHTIASFVANSVVAERGATERLAQAFEALVPDSERKDRLLELAEIAARQTDAGGESGFDELWKSAADMLTSYSDEKFVSDEYARELTAARSQAVEVERVADDPPERVQEWVATVSDAAVRQLDLSLLLDLARIEDDPREWEQLAVLAVMEVDRRIVLGDVDAAQRLVDAVVRERGPDGRATLAKAASAAVDKLAAGPLARHVVGHLRKVNDSGMAALTRLCHTIGPGVVRPLAEALAAEENNRAVRALREILLGFGAAGRQSVEQLKSSSNPAVRRTAIDLLRVLGGDEALPELASMLGDADPQVQRDAIRAIVQIGTPKAYGVLERALAASTAAHDTIIEQLLGLREEKAIPLLCYVLNNTRPRGSLTKAHADIIEALGNLKPHPDSTRALQAALHRGEWWAPLKTATLREAAATALLRLGSPEANAVLEEAARTGSRGVRKIARAKVDIAARRERDRA
jgi:hypothetical protein